MIFSTEQWNAIEAHESKVAVIAAAGSGKTTVIIEHIIALLERGVFPSDICAITYTNNAAQQMRDRIGKAGDGMFIGTIHSLANQILLSNKVSTIAAIEAEDFDRLFYLIRRKKVQLPRIQHLLVDEFQDIAESEYKFIFEDLKPDNYFIVGDSRQAIYGFTKRANFKFFNNLIHNPTVKKYQLTNNYRNPDNISYFGYRFIYNSREVIHTPVKCVKKYKGEIEELPYDRFHLLAALRKSDTYNDWFILTRSNPQIEELIPWLTKQGIPCETFKQSEKTYWELMDTMKSNTVKVLTIHSAKGLEANNVAVIGTNTWTEEERRVCYVAATRAKERLIWYTLGKKQSKSPLIATPNLIEF